MNNYYKKTITLSLSLLVASCTHLYDDGLYQEEPSAWTVEQNNNQLMSINTLLKSGKNSEAKQLADSINVADLTPEQKPLLDLLYAQILLNFGEAEQAANKLAHTNIETLSNRDRINYYQSQAFAYSLTGNLFEQAKARIALDGILGSEERKKNQAIIIETIGLLPEASASQLKSQGADYVGWVTIAKTLGLRNQNPADFNTALAEWRANNPQHPANIYVTSVGKLAEEGDMPSSIAILLPASGLYADAAKAIKAGFQAAHERNKSTNKPVLTFYDTEKAKLAELYQKAVTDGAKLVIGPLQKESIQSLASSTALSIPVLALNSVPELNRQNLYQFAISPLDDVTEITQKAFSDGHKRAFVLAPNNDQGKRLSSLLISNWQALNGTVLEKHSYDPTSGDYSSLIKKLFNLDESDQRFKKILGYFPTALALSHKRQDVDALFLSAYSKEGSAINSAFQARQDNNLAVYAMPTIYSGTASSGDSNALNGITFCDMPWLFNGAYGGDLSKISLSSIWSRFPDTYIRLVAMGIDAYHLSAKLSDLSPTTPYPGATGNLTLTPDNRIKRKLVCAKFIKGQPELIGYTHDAADTHAPTTQH